MWVQRWHCRGTRHVHTLPEPCSHMCSWTDSLPCSADVLFCNPPAPAAVCPTYRVISSATNRCVAAPWPVPGDDYAPYHGAKSAVLVLYMIVLSIYGTASINAVVSR
eukprot:TRINITY_DN2287_c0_g2_i1.p1 TRINITY_DN2287_c0_g2~~TRINITY_DN2287_c0_g2_i1.p1  ORF type:complete len:107 (+),score=0.16 TRINITY_DN2287_c0_g2_i1:471-791(+)